MTRVSVTVADGGSCDAWLALPPGGRGPGLLLLQEIFGVNAALRERAAWFAGCGFVVLAPDLFWRQERWVQLTDRTDAEWEHAVALYERLDEDLAVRDAAAALAGLRALPACTGLAGATGWCLGGRLAYLLAARGGGQPGGERGRPDAGVGYYPVGLERSLPEAPAIVTPLLLHFAAKDDYCRPPVQAAIHAVLDRHPQLTLHDYPGVGHGFARPGGRNFDAAAAALADGRSLAFLQRHLAGAAVRSGA